VRLLVISPNQSNKWNWGHQHLRDEFYRHCEVVYYGHGYKEKGYPSIQREVDRLGPFDAVLCWDQSYGDYIQGMQAVTIPKLLFLVDYVPTAGKSKKNNDFINKHGFDVAFLRSTACLNEFRKNQNEHKIPSHTTPVFLPFGVDLTKYKYLGLRKKYDVCSIFSLVSWAYPRRPALIEAIQNMNIKYRVAGTNSRNRVVHNDYIRILNESTMFANSNGTYKSVLMKYFEVMACNTLLVTDEPTDGNRMRFIDGENIVYYRNIADAVEKIRYYIAHPIAGMAIANAGSKLVKEYHGNDQRVKQVLDVIEGF